MKYLQPFILYERYFQPVQDEIQRAFNDIFYKKLFAIVHIEEFQNSITTLLQAIRQGRIYYEGGIFKGKFSARTTIELRSIGAVYDSTSRTWSLKPDDLPTDIKFAQAAADDRTRHMRMDVIDAIDDIHIDQLDLFEQTKKKYNASLDVMQKDFEHAARSITIVPKLSDQQRETLSKEYAQNLDLYIKDWAEENIVKLRGEVQQHALAGGRAESLEKVLINNYGSSQAKAKFLARQETSLLMSKFRESRYADIGIDEYRWSGANDERERPDHKALNGKVFSFKNPPITNKKTGARNNPGEDYGCRCIAIPIVR